jgi:hypothetical protein
VVKPAQGDASETGLMRSIDFSRAIASLRLLGADRLDPIGLHYLEVLANRTNAQSGNVKRILEDKLKHALDAFEQRFQQAQCDAKEAIALKCDEQHASLSGLTRLLTHHSTPYADRASPDSVGVRIELKSVRRFRKTWSTLSAKKQVAQALDQAPKNAGPINSHMLVLRSLALMHDISPDYLTRFMSYADTLLGLDQGDKAKQSSNKAATHGTSGKKANRRRMESP